MSDEKDRFGQKIHDLEKAREDQWARDEDQKLIEKLRHRQPAELHCPQCNDKLVPHAEAYFAMMACPNDHGAWLDKVAIEKVIRAKSS
jgi:Zn-finger nucleic acid-binding protein